MHFLQSCAHFSKTCCILLITSKISCLRAPFSWLEKPKNRMGRDLNWILCSAWRKCIGGTPLEHPPYSPDLAPCDFWAFSTMKRELRCKKFRSDQRSAARFREVGGALYEVHRLPRVVLRKRDRHRTSTKFRIGVINKVSPRTFQTSVLYTQNCNKYYQYFKHGDLVLFRPVAQPSEFSTTLYTLSHSHR
jgi:hypothetical protein